MVYRLKTAFKSGIAVGCFVTAVSACITPAAPTEEAALLSTTASPTVASSPTASPLPPTPTPPSPTITAAANHLVTETTNPPASATPSPPKPTPTPSQEQLRQQRYANWGLVEMPALGLTMAAPPRWVNLNRLLSPELANAGIQFWADSKVTGARLLRGQPLQNGEFFILMPAAVPPPADPLTGLQTIVGNAPYLRQPALLPAAQAGAYADLGRDPTGLFSPSLDTGLRIRTVILLSPQGNEPALSLLGGGTDNWRQAEPIFRQILESILWQIPHSPFVERGELSPDHIAEGIVGGSLTDVYTFMGKAGDYAGILAAPVDEMIDLTLTLYAPTGKLVDSVNYGLQGESETMFDTFLSEFGEYRVEIGEAFNNSGRYQLELNLSDSPQYNNGGALTFGQNVSGQVSERAKPNWRFFGEAGQVITLILRPETERLDLILSLTAPDGTQLIDLDEGFAGDSEALIGYRLPITGDYMARVRSFANATGKYRLSLSEGADDTVNFFDAGDLTYGAIQQQNLRPFEAQVWFFYGEEGDEIQISALPISPNMDLDLWLLDNQIQLLQRQDKNGVNEGEQISFRLPADGDYLILTQEFFGEEGGYEIRLSSAESAKLMEQEQLASNEPITVGLAAGKINVHSFAANFSDSLAVTLASDSPKSDFVLELVAPDSTIAFRLDDAFAGETEQIVAFVLPAGGIWQVRVSEFFDQGGEYRLLADWE